MNAMKKFENDLAAEFMKFMEIQTPRTEQINRKNDILRPNQTSNPKKTLSERLIKKVDESEGVSDNLNKELIKFLSKQRKRQQGVKVEIEASFGIFQDTFVPGIRSQTEFINLKKELKKEFKSIEIRDIVEIAETEQGNIRCIVNPDYPEIKIYERKIRNRKDAVIITKYGVRVTRSTEENVDDPNHFIPHIKRIRNRTSFFTSDTSSPFIGYSIDMTDVQEERIENGQTVSSVLKHELEIEIMDTKTAKNENFIKVIEYVYSLLSRGSIKSKLAYMNLYEREYAIDLHNILFSNEISAKKKVMKRFHMYSDTYWNKPRDIKRYDLEPSKNKNGRLVFHLTSSYPTIKLDGKRFLLMVSRRACYLIMPPFTVIKFAKLTIDKYDGTLLDGELVDDTFHAFDILFFKNKDVRDEKFLKRLQFVEEVVPAIKAFEGNVLVKKFYKEGDIYDRLSQAGKDYKKMVRKNKNSSDGVIVQPGHYYKNNTTLKWKPVEKLSIDFKLVPAGHEDIHNSEKLNLENLERSYILYVKIKNKPDLIRFQPKHSEYDGVMVLAKKDKTLDNSIVECEWNGKDFFPVRIRDDRNYPNADATAYDVWSNIHNPVSLDTLMGKDLIMMRRYHNYLKGQMLNKYTEQGTNIIDIGSGRGGDLSKWRENGINKVFCIEPNKDNSKILIERYQDEKEKFKEKAVEIELLSFGAEKTKKIKKKIEGEKIDAITSFFSMTFFASNEETWDKLFDTIDILPEGGRFIGSVMDGQRVHDLLDAERRWKSLSYKNLEEKLKEIQSQITDLTSLKIINELSHLEEKKKEILSVLQEIEQETKTKEYQIKSESLEKIQRKIQKNPKKDSLIEEADELMEEMRINEHRELKKEVEDIKKKISELSKSTNTAMNIDKVIALEKEAKKISLEMRVRGKGYEPIDDDDVIEYDCSAFSIEQTSFFDMKKPTGNEIEITLKDKTSMVKNQQEWLVNYKNFRKRMNVLGFKEIENFFAEGLDANYLPRDSLTFSSLNRFFCFERMPDKIEVKFPKKIDQETELSSSRYEDMVLIGVEKETFINAFLRSLEIETEDKDKFAEKEKHVFARKLKMQTFENYRRSTFWRQFDEDPEKALEKFRNEITKGNIPDDLWMNFLSKRFDVAIYLLEIDERKVQVLNSVLDCKDLDDKENHIIIGKIGADRYCSIGIRNEEGEIQTNMTEDEGLIDRLKRKAC